VYVGYDGFCRYWGLLKWVFYKKKRNTVNIGVSFIRNMYWEGVSKGELWEIFINIY
jgi:hypothetical protein